MENKKTELNDEVLEQVSGGGNLDYTWKCPKCGMPFTEKTLENINRKKENHIKWHELFG